MTDKLNWFDKIMSAVTFAEAGEHDTAREILNEGKESPNRTQECPHCGGSVDVEGMHPHKV